MQKYFQKTLSDVIRIAKSNSADSSQVLQILGTEIRNEMKSQDLKTKITALLKLLYLRMEQIDIHWVNFEILNLMSNAQFNAKRLAFTIASLTFEEEAEVLFMATNQFEKELGTPKVEELSSCLSCLSNILNKDLAQSEKILSLTLGLISHNKPLIRKKAFIVLHKIMHFSTNSVNNDIITKIVGKISQEKNNSVLICYASLVQFILSSEPKWYPLFLDSLDNILENSKNNWLLIKVIKIFDYLIQFEPRLVQKYSKVYSEMLKITKAKSIQYELILTIIKHFTKNQTIYAQAREQLTSFINNSDPNLRNLGISSLNKMILNNPSIVTELLNKYLSYLLESYQKSDISTKIQILEIFQNFTSADNLKQIIAPLIKSINNKEQMQINDKIIFVVLKICSKNQFQNIGQSNFEWLLNIVLKPIMQDIKSIQNANLFSKILNVKILDLTIQVENFQQQIFDFSVQALQFLNLQTTQNSEDANKITILNVKNQNNQIATYTEILFTTFIYLIGENSQQSKDAEQFLQILSLFNQDQLFKQFQNSFQCFLISEFKVFSILNKIKFQIIINFFYFLFSTQDNNLDKDSLLKYITKAFQFYISSAKSQIQLSSLLVANIYSLMLFKTFSLDIEQLMKLNGEELECALKSQLNNVQNIEQMLQSIDDIRKLFCQKKNQIHPNVKKIYNFAQSFVKPPNDLDLIKEVLIDTKELAVIQLLMKQLDQTSAEEAIQQPKSVPKESKIVKFEENKEELKEQDEQKQEEKEQISYKVNQQLDLPIGVTLMDVQKQQDQVRVQYYQVKKYNKEETSITKLEEKEEDSTYQSL